MDFEWDTAKADANLAKHGVDFGGARQVFDDPDVLITADPRVYGETRFRATGTVRSTAITVIYTMRGGNTCRIISARRASRRERGDYSLQARN
jgi:uncharacterized protein